VVSAVGSELYGVCFVNQSFEGFLPFDFQLADGMGNINFKDFEIDVGSSFIKRHAYFAGYLYVAFKLFAGGAFEQFDGIVMPRPAYAVDSCFAIFVGLRKIQKAPSLAGNFLNTRNFGCNPECFA
jgi:hypothetical protein